MLPAAPARRVHRSPLQKTKRSSLQCGCESTDLLSQLVVEHLDRQCGTRLFISLFEDQSITDGLGMRKVQVLEFRKELLKGRCREREILVHSFELRSRSPYSKGGAWQPDALDRAFHKKDLFLAVDSIERKFEGRRPTVQAKDDPRIRDSAIGRSVGGMTASFAIKVVRHARTMVSRRTR